MEQDIIDRLSRQLVSERGRRDHGKKGHTQANNHNNNAQQAAKRMIELMLDLSIPQCTSELT